MKYITAKQIFSLIPIISAAATKMKYGKEDFSVTWTIYGFVLGSAEVLIVFRFLLLHI